jgi:hypothetical protein
MHTIRLISLALRKKNPEWLPDLPSLPVTGTCAVTGEQTECLPRHKVLGKSFTNQGVLAAPDSPYIGVDVFYAWFSGYKATPEKKRIKAPERMSSWWCDGETFQELSRQDVRDYVLQPRKAATWAGYATTSYKKHGSLLAPINNGDSAIWLFEETLIDCSDTKKVTEYWHKLTETQRQGFERSILEAVECPASLMMKYGFACWHNFAKWAKPRKAEALYRFLCYLLPSMEELKHENSANR